MVSVMLVTPTQHQRRSFLGITRGVLGAESEHTEKSESLNVCPYKPLGF